MDTARSGIEILPEAIDALAKHDSNWRSTFEVYVDGGIRRGSDIFKALALGADAVCIGRAYIWGLAAFGQPGVEKVLEMLKAELRMVMGQVGATSVNEISAMHIGTRQRF